MSLATSIVKGLVLRVAPERVLIALKKAHYTRTLRRLSENEEAEFAIIRKLVRSGDYVGDVGANVGLYTKLLSDLVGPMGRVYSVEPVPPTYEILCHCQRKLQLNNVVAINCAVSNAAAKVMMKVPQYSSGGDNYYEAYIVPNRGEKPPKHYEVEAKSLDHLFADCGGRLAFIKIDVEGHELAVLKGAPNTINNHLPALLIEVNSDPDDGMSSAAELFRLLEGSGYQSYWSEGEHIYPRQSGQHHANYFFLRPEHKECLEEHGVIFEYKSKGGSEEHAIR